MKRNVIHFLRKAFPYLIAIGLWRLSDNFWNPAGVLALIPIFYCSFVKRTAWFALYSVILCILIDYQFSTVLYWTAMYCIFYAAIGFQTYIDLPRADNRAWQVFMICWWLCIIILVFTHFDISNVLRGLWLGAWGSLLYGPLTRMIEVVNNDR